MIMGMRVVFFVGLSISQVYSEGPVQPISSVGSVYSEGPVQPISSVGSVYSEGPVQPLSSVGNVYSEGPVQPLSSVGNVYSEGAINVVDGEILHITKVSRLHMGAYLCIASNGVPPSISKRVLLRVQFPPMLSIPNQLEGAYIGQDVSLECHTEAYPTSINYWTTERGDMIVSGEKYESVTMDNGYNKYMMLKVRGVSKGDFGSYKCVAKNSLGETDGLIKLDGEYSQLIRAHSLSCILATAPDSGAFHDVNVHSHSRHDAHLLEEESLELNLCALFSPGSLELNLCAIFSPGSLELNLCALFSSGSLELNLFALFSPGSLELNSVLSPRRMLVHWRAGQRYRKQWKPRLEGGNRSRDYEVEGWRDSGEMEGFRLWRLYAAISGSTSRDTELRPPTEGPLVPTLLFVLPATLRGQLILLVPTPSAMALLYSHPRDCNAAAYNVLYGLERGGKGTPIRRIKLEVGRSTFKSRLRPKIYLSPYTRTHHLKTFLGRGRVKIFQKRGPLGWEKNRLCHPKRRDI
uniref:Ig-like domain-containing protein n=1 Tax=Timema monikensis TaxID=170555 RepID=A0A7R9ECM4_9NEOP|nr:unnamed protein product [Timema monikensis]